MKNERTLKFSACLLFVMFGFLVLFTVTSKAQSNSSDKCWQMREVWELQLENQFNGFTGKSELVPVNKLVKKLVNVCESPAPNKTETPTQNQSDEYSKIFALQQGLDFKKTEDNPLLGTWKYVEFLDVPNCCGASVVSPPVKRSFVFTFSQNGTLDISWTESYLSGNSKAKWMYEASKDDSSGKVSQYDEKEKVVERGDIRWINKKQFEYTVTSHANPKVIGLKMMFTRQ